MDPVWFEWFIRQLTNKWKVNKQLNLTFSHKQKDLYEDIERKTREKLGSHVTISKTHDFPVKGRISLCFTYEE